MLPNYHGIFCVDLFNCYSIESLFRLAGCHDIAIWVLTTLLAVSNVCLLQPLVQMLLGNISLLELAPNYQSTLLSSEKDIATSQLCAYGVQAARNFVTG